VAEIDVTEILADPDLADSFVVTRTRQITDTHGRTVALQPSTTTVVGVVQPMSGRTLNMMPDMVNVSGAIELWTTYRLEGPSETTQSDVVTWQGRNYMVQNVQPFTNYGQGYVHAVCQLIDLVAKDVGALTDTGP
jgi:hypothetical protein